VYCEALQYVFCECCVYACVHVVLRYLCAAAAAGVADATGAAVAGTITADCLAHCGAATGYLLYSLLLFDCFIFIVVVSKTLWLTA
jgi:hypothetical protein